MEKALLLIIVSVVVGVVGMQKTDYAANQMVDFKRKTKGRIETMTTSSGAPVDMCDASSSLNKHIHNNPALMESLSHIGRERIPERIGHGKGAGAFGYFESTYDLSKICKTKMFCEVGKKTPIAVRFSTSSTGLGGSDTQREGRGMAVKFYTTQGILDLIGFSTPIIFSKDPVLFPARMKAIKKNPATNLFDANILWDYLSTFPENLFSYLYILSDRGICNGYRHMAAYTMHTFEVYNNNGTKSFLRFHFRPDAGIQNLNSSEALRIAAIDRDYAIRDLYNSIENHETKPSWKLSVQILCQKDVDEARKTGLDVFSVSNLLPVRQFPLLDIGRFVLNRTPTNYHSEFEMIAFCPSHMIPGILGAPDKIFKARSFFYKDAQNYRLGSNHQNIPVNCPMNSPALTYNRDGRAPVNANGGNMPNYYPNSFKGPEPCFEKNRPSLSQIHELEPNNYRQAENFYLNEISPEEQMRLVQNAAKSICPAAHVVQKRTVEAFNLINPDLGSRIAKELAANNC